MSKEERRLIDMKYATDSLRETRKKTRDPVNLAQCQENAINASTDHDKNWSYPGEKDDMDLVKRMLTKTFWKEVPSDQFLVDLFRVIPSFESDEAWGKSKNQIITKPKKECKYDLGKHLTLIKNISLRKAKNTIDDTDLTGMTENAILRVFIKFDRSVSQASRVKKDDDKKKKLKAVFGLFGTDPSTRQRYTAEYAYAMENNIDGANDDDGDDNEEEEQGCDELVASLFQE